MAKQQKPQPIVPINDNDILIGADVGTNATKVTVCLPRNLMDNGVISKSSKIAVPTKITSINQNEYKGKMFLNAVTLDFVDALQNGNFSPRYFATGNSGRGSVHIDGDADWRTKYNSEYYTPAFWYGVVRALHNAGIQSGDYNLHFSVCYNVNIPENTVRRLAFPLESGVYNVEYLHEGVFQNYNLNVDMANVQFVRETQAAIIYKTIKSNDGNTNPFCVFDIGHGSTQANIVEYLPDEDGKLKPTITRTRDFNIGIGDVQNRVRHELEAIYGWEVIQKEDIEGYMRDSGLPERERIHANSQVARTVGELLYRCGYELAITILDSATQGYWNKLRGAGGGSVQLLGVLSTILKEKEKEGVIRKATLPELIASPHDNQYCNVYGAQLLVVLPYIGRAVKLAKGK